MALLFLISSCASENPVAPPSLPDESLTTNFISAEKARQRLSGIVSDINSQIPDPVNRIAMPKSTARMDVVSLDAEMHPLTRGAAETDAQCYVFRMENDMFAIMSATTDQPELLAIGNGYPNFEGMANLMVIIS